MRIVTAAIGLALTLGVPLSAFAQPAAMGQAERDANNLVQTSRPMLPQDLGDGIMVTEARAEGRVFVMTLRLPDAQQQFVSLIEAEMLRGLCETAPHLFANGMTIRLDAVVGTGAVRVGRTMSRCPAA